jgi:hypothetical protein
MTPNRHETLRSGTARDIPRLGRLRLARSLSGVISKTFAEWRTTVVETRHFNRPIATPKRG